MALTPVLRRLRGRRVVLASASPRRRDILGYTVTASGAGSGRARAGLGRDPDLSPVTPQGVRFEVVPSRFPETLDTAAFATPHDYARENARRKALEVALRLREVSEGLGPLARAAVRQTWVPPTDVISSLLLAPLPQKDQRAPDVVIGADTVVVRRPRPAPGDHALVVTTPPAPLGPALTSGPPLSRPRPLPPGRGPGDPGEAAG